MTKWQSTIVSHQDLSEKNTKNFKLHFISTLYSLIRREADFNFYTTLFKLYKIIKGIRLKHVLLKPNECFITSRFA